MPERSRGCLACGNSSAALPDQTGISHRGPQRTTEKKFQALRAKRRITFSVVLCGPLCETLACFLPHPRASLRRQTAGRPLPSGRGKSGLHGNTVPANGRRGRPQGKCHRKQAARARAARSPAGKGETVRQERTAPLATGAAGQTPPGARPNRGGGAARHRSVPAPPPGLVARGVPRGMPKRNGRPALQGDLGCGQNPAYRPSGIYPNCIENETRIGTEMLPMIG